VGQRCAAVALAPPPADRVPVLRSGEARTAENARRLPGGGRGDSPVRDQIADAPAETAQALLRALPQHLPGGAAERPRPEVKGGRRRRLRELAEALWKSRQEGRRRRRLQSRRSCSTRDCSRLTPEKTLYPRRAGQVRLRQGQIRADFRDYEGRRTRVRERSRRAKAGHGSGAGQPRIPAPPGRRATTSSACSSTPASSARRRWRRTARPEDPRAAGRLGEPNQPLVPPATSPAADGYLGDTYLDMGERRTVVEGLRGGGKHPQEAG